MSCKKCKSENITIHRNIDDKYWFQCEDCGECVDATKEDWGKLE